MNPQDRDEKMQLRQEYQNVWHADLLNTVQADPQYCCFALMCAPCASYLLRKRALYEDMSRYVCCAGYMPCSGQCGEHKSPELCLATEVMCCFGSSVSSTRWLIQDEFDIQTTKCDNCIIGFMICINEVACIFSLIACILGSDELRDAAEILKCIANLVYCSVCTCMQTQHKIELDKRDGMYGAAGLMAVPPVQKMSRLDQPYPPTVGYLPDQQHQLHHPVPGYYPPYAAYPHYDHYLNQPYPPPHIHPLTPNHPTAIHHLTTVLSIKYTHPPPILLHQLTHHRVTLHLASHQLINPSKSIGLQIEAYLEELVSDIKL